MTVQAVEAFSPYSNTLGMSASLPTWMNEYDAQRINAYQIYEQIYWNVPETFKLSARGEENSPIYLPTSRTIVDTTARYVAVSPSFLVDPDLGSPDEQEQCRRMFRSLFRREKFWSKFQANKLYGIMRGDWLWHILANPNKPLGTRIKLEPLDPAAYFPVTHPDDPDRIIAVHIVEQVVDPSDNKTYIRRQTYQRGNDPIANDGSDTTIINSIGLFDVSEWQALGDRAITVLKPPTPLPPSIKTIPVYHLPNIVTPGDPFGSSELRGFERIMAAVNQAVSDEELALALEGLGMYATDGGPPRDEAGRVTDWVLGPGRVVEHAPGSKFERINGISSVQPVQDHLRFLINQLKEAAAIPDAAVGKVDVQVAESGISLILQLQPLLAKRDLREEPIADVHTNMFFDLKMWFEAYEQFTTPCIVQPVFGNPVPDDVDAVVERVLKIVDAGLADAEWGRQELSKVGYVFPDGTGQAVLDEMAARAAATDPFAARMQDDLESEDAEV